jgi:methylthioribose-1-phosphate isomerase
MDASAAAEEGAAQAVIATASKETAQAEIAQAQAQTTVAQQGTQTAIWQLLPVGLGVAVIGAGIIGYLIYRSNRQRDELLQTVISQSQMGTAAQ